MQITKDSRIVEVFSSELHNNVKDKNELKDAHDYIKELASNPSPDNRYEIGQIMSYIIDDGLTARVNYLELIGDVKQIEQGEKAQFEIGIDGLKAFWQAKSSSTERSQVSTKYVQLDTDEVSIRPQVNFHDIVTGKVNLVRIAESASRKMELAVVKRVQDVVYHAFKDTIGTSPNYAMGSGVTKGDFNPILYAMRRAGGQASIIGDVEALTKFTELTGFNGDVPEGLAVEHNQNGMIGKYLGSPLVQLDNPLQPQSWETELRKDLIYVIPNAESSLKPVKIVLEGEVMSGDAVYDINSKITEFRFDKWVGAGIVGARKLLGVYEDSTLS